MQCPQCQVENPARARFCEDCGARLEFRCPRCGEAARPGKKFCASCGGSLVTAPATSRPAPSPQDYTPQHLAERILTSRAALEGERKQVTVLFADLKGSMELLADRDPEEARRILDPVLERMMAAVHHYEGTVNQVLGDGIMALFGAPLAHEDHAVRACYAALRMQEAVKQYADALLRTSSLRVQIRVGLNSGEVVVRSIGSDLHMDYTAIGQTTHLAARMEQTALPGSILLTPDTLRLVEGYVQVQTLGPVPIKGLEQPVEVYELVGAGQARTRLQAAAARGFTRFVGRDGELEVLRRTLERAGAGQGQLVALVGEPGVGKSRLTWEFTHSHRTRGWLVLESTSVSYGKATAYLPVVDLLRAYCGIEARDEPRRVREKLLGKLLGLDEALRPTLPAFLALLDVPADDPAWEGLDPPQRRQRTLDALKRLLLRESQVQPLLVVFEDLHWIDAETQALLDSLVESLPTARILLLVNYRPEYEHAWHRKNYHQQLRLDPLPPESTDALLSALLGDADKLQALKQALSARTEGNPLFVEESIRALVESGVLAGERGSYRLVRPFESTQVPATVQAVLAARIDRLPPEDKRLLQTAAVIGKDVPFALLQAIAELPEDAPRQGLARLQAAEFLYETSLYPDLEYTFKHALAHEVAYGSLLQERRRALHARIVEAMEALYPGRPAEQVERLAEHAVRGEVWAKAVAYLRQAGERAAARSALHEAIAYFEQALGALDHLPESRATLEQALVIRLDLGPALMNSKGAAAPAVEETYTRARELCERLGATAQLFPALWGLWRLHSARAELQAARQLGEELYAVAERVQDPALLLEAHHALWATLFPLGELAAALAHTERGIALYDTQQHHRHAFLYGGHDPRMNGLVFAAQTLWLLGYPEQALKRSHDALALARELAHPVSLAMTLNWAAEIHQHRGEAQAAREHVEAALALATERQMRIAIVRGTLLRGRLLAEEGQTAEGIAQMREGRAALPETGLLGGFESYGAALLAETYLTEGQTEKGLGVVAEALARAHETGEGWYEAELNRLQGELLLAQAAPAEDEAERCFREALALARWQEARSLELRAATSLARLWQRQGKRAEARELLAGVYGWFSEGFETRDLRQARALLGELS